MPVCAFAVLKKIKNVWHGLSFYCQKWEITLVAHLRYLYKWYIVNELNPSICFGYLARIRSLAYKVPCVVIVAFGFIYIQNWVCETGSEDIPLASSDISNQIKNCSHHARVRTWDIYCVYVIYAGAVCSHMKFKIIDRVNQKTVGSRPLSTADPKIWNKIPSSIRTIVLNDVFRKKWKHAFLNMHFRIWFMYSAYIWTQERLRKNTIIIIIIIEIN